MDTTFSTASIARDAAHASIASAEAASRDLGIRVTIAVTDAGGIGISGGNARQDRDAAEIALKSLGFEVAA